MVVHWGWINSSAKVGVGELPVGVTVDQLEEDERLALALHLYAQDENRSAHKCSAVFAHC